MSQCRPAWLSAGWPNELETFEARPGGPGQFDVCELPTEIPEVGFVLFGRAIADTGLRENKRVTAHGYERRIQFRSVERTRVSFVRDMIALLDMTPLVGAALGAVFLDETIGTGFVIGGAVMAVGIYFVNTDDARTV